ncbi:MAG: hypothetical protein HXY24_08680 [Rubrivivax sp.]|nr:hypothetical protein [Rubrivivax sp.]
MSFSKILIANRGDNPWPAPVAAKARVGAADASRSHIARHAKRAAIEPRS